MNGRLAKKIRKVNRRNWKQFYSELMTLTWFQRVGIAWYLVMHKRQKYDFKGRTVERN